MAKQYHEINDIIAESKARKIFFVVTAVLEDKPTIE